MEKKMEKSGMRRESAAMGRMEAADVRESGYARNGLSRRAFLGGATLAGVGAFAAGLAGCAPSSNSSKGGDSSNADGGKAVEHNPASTEDFDIVVVGSGTAGTCAALRAAELGARVLCLEKRNALCGTSAFAEGLCGIGSEYQAGQGVEIDKLAVVKDTMEYHHYACLGPVVRTFVDTCGEVVDWVAGEGVEYAAVEALGESYRVWHLPAGDDGAPTAMKHVLDILQAKATELGVEFRMEAPMTGLVVENGVVSGVYAKQGDGEVQVNAKAVVLATGGYASNADLFEKFTGRPYDGVRVWGMEGRDGDGIAFATAEAGADTHIPSAVMYHTGALEGTDAFSDVPNFVLTMQPTMRVNETGERYFNEGVTTNFSATGNVLTTQAENYVIFDDAYIDHIEQAGPFCPMPNLGAFVGQPYECRDGVVSCPGVVSGDTVAEVAEALGLDAAALEATVERYNGFCEKGVDEDYGKPAEMLLPVSTPPFYGSKITPTLFTTVGGLRVNERMQVMGVDGVPVEGLFAAGGDAAGLYGANYDVDVCSGSQQGWAATSGYIAAEVAFA